MRLGLRTKFFLHSNAVILVSISLATWMAVKHERRSRHEAIAQRGLSIAEVLSIPITDALLYQELGLIVEEGLIDNYVGEVMARNKDLVRYVVVMDAAGRVTHSTRWELLGRRYPRALGPDAVGRPTVSDTHRSESGEQLLEVRAPLHVSSRFWGSLAVGFTLAPIEEEAQAIARQAVLVALVLILGNSLLTAAYVETLIRPVLNLNRIMRGAASGDLSARVEGGRGDEVAELGETFNRMMAQLGHARDREKAQEAQLARAEKMAAIGTLATGVAHEVNNPLAGMLTCLDLIEASPDDADARKRYLALVRDGMKRIEHIVANLLDFSRLRRIEARPTSMNERLLHVTELAAYPLRKQGIEVRHDVAPEGDVVLADPFQLEQLLLNLVLNAVQAMPGGGVLTLRTRTAPGAVVTDVSDTGSGISEEIRARIFDPFFTTRGVGEGTGLGLSVSYGIVTAHGGTIEVESAVGAGSTFRITLPAASETHEWRKATG